MHTHKSRENRIVCHLPNTNSLIYREGSMTKYIGGTAQLRTSSEIVMRFLKSSLRTFRLENRQDINMSRPEMKCHRKTNISYHFAVNNKSAKGISENMRFTYVILLRYSALVVLRSYRIICHI